jgi:hypothetical protein
MVIGFAGLAVFIMGGIVPGLNSLYGVLYEEGAFISHCPAARARACAEQAHNRSHTPQVCCRAQDELLAAMSSMGLFASDGVMLLYGELLDRKGARLCCGVALVLSWLGFALLALNSSLLLNDFVWMLAFFCIGVAGPGVFMSCLSFGECFPSLQPLITALAASMWDASSIVFYLFSILYFEAGLPFSTIALLWLAVIVAVGSTVWTQLPTREQLAVLRAHGAECASTHMTRSGGLAELLTEQPAPMEHCGVLPPSCRSATTNTTAAAAAATASVDLLSSSLQEPITTGETLRAPLYSAEDSVWSLFVRRDTMLLLVFMSAFNLKSSFYIVSLRDQLAALGLPAAAVEQTSNLFNLAFPIGGFVSSFATMALLNRWRRSEHLYIGLVLSLACAFSVANLLPSLWAQQAAAIIFGPTRTLQWAAYFLLLEQHDRYPPAMLGRMIGRGNLVIALVGDGPPAPLKAYAQQESWPADAFGRYQLVHAALAVIIFGCLALPLLLARDIRQRTIQLPPMEPHAVNR